MNTSVIVTTYNRPDALLQVIHGLRHQTRPPGEVIIADDGSGPETTKALKELNRLDLPFELIHVWQPDKGFRAARIRNKAIHQSGGDYIILLDGDCIPERHFIADHLRLAEPGTFFQGKRVLLGPQRSWDFSFRHMDSLVKRLKLFLSKEVGNRHHLIRLPWFPTYRSTSLSGIKTCNMGFYRQDIYAVNGFNQDFVGWGREDSELAVRFFKYGLKKKQHPFLAICFHLWHRENDRSYLPQNDIYLQRAKEADTYVCKNGLVPYKTLDL